MNDRTVMDAKLRMMLETEKELVSKLKENERYKYFLGRMQYITYEGGKENLLEADCSGSVCMALLLATDCSIRVTADTLYRKFFTKRNPEKDDISAVFFITHYDRKLGNKLYHEGEVAHIAGICGDGVVLNCVEPAAYLRSLDTMRIVYQSMDYDCVMRGLDRDVLQKASEEGKDLFGPDPQFEEFRRAVTEEKGV
jgi:murein DD-endopeptidase